MGNSIGGQNAVDAVAADHQCTRISPAPVPSKIRPPWSSASRSSPGMGTRRGSLLTRVVSSIHFPLLKVLVCLYESIDELHRQGWINIVVHLAVNKKQFALEVFPSGIPIQNLPQRERYLSWLWSPADDTATL